jgi:hypothetical protein
MKVQKVLNRFLTFMVLPGLIVTLLGCNAMPLKTAEQSLDQAHLAESAIFLKYAHFSPSTKVVLRNTPWGNSVEVQVLNQYDAASGRTCIQVTLVAQQTQQLLCQSIPNYWESVRTLSLSTLANKTNN